jgi:hypothetical protein
MEQKLKKDGIYYISIFKSKSSQRDLQTLKHIEI